MKALIRTIIVDDDARKFGQAFADAFEILSDRIKVVGIFDDYAQVVEKIQELRVQLVLMDIDFGPKKEGKGIEAVQMIRQKYQEEQLKVIMLTERDDIDAIRRSFKAGASGYIQKSNRGYSWLDYVIGLVDNNQPTIEDSRIAAKLIHSFRENNPFQLQLRELEILQLSADGKTMDEIAEITRYKYNTIATFIRDLRDKMDAQNIAHAVALAFRNNLIV